MADNVAAPAADEDYDVTADLTAAFDAAESDAPVEKVEPEETAEQTAERVRDEKGRFASREGDKGLDTQAKEPSPKTAAEADPQAVSAKPEQQLLPERQELTEPVKPPPGFSPTAKVVWDKETLSKEEWAAVKNDIAKRNDEVGKGLAELTEYKPLKQYIEMARNGGTTLPQALDRYINIEQQITRDIIGGVAQIAQNQGIHPVALANQILARYGAAPSEVQAGDQQQARQPANVDLTPITNELNALKSYVQQQRQGEILSQVEKFAADPAHPFYHNVEERMIDLVQAAKAINKPITLDQAYENACWENPEIRGLLIKQQSSPASDPSAKVAAATQARAASKSITGSPIPNVSAKGPETSIEDDIRAQFEAASV